MQAIKPMQNSGFVLIATKPLLKGSNMDIISEQCSYYETNSLNKGRNLLKMRITDQYKLVKFDNMGHPATLRC